MAASVTRDPGAVKPSMPVALVWLNASGPSGVSHGLLLLARELSEAGHAVTTYHLSPELGGPTDSPALVEALSTTLPKLVGLSFASPDASLARDLVGQIRSALPTSLIFCGGIHATLAPEAVFAWPEVDGVGLGELDGGIFSTLVDRLARGDRPIHVPGFWLRWGGQEHRNPMAPLPSLEHQAMPLYDGVDLDLLVRKKRGFGEVLAGRGCPHRCHFCQNAAIVDRYRESLGTAPASWPYLRHRGIKGLMEELRELKARAPSLKAIMFADDRLAGDHAWLTAFAERYRAEIGLPFIVNATADQIRPDTAALLRHAGCNMVKLGVECAPGDRRRLVLGRPESEARLRAAFDHLRDAGINTMAYLMIGLPGETRETLEDTFRYTASLMPDAVRVSMFCPYPGTRLFDQLLSSGQIASDHMSPGFGDPSVLHWSSNMGERLRRSLRLLPWLLNQHLPEVAEASAFLLKQALATDLDSHTGDDSARLLVTRMADLLRQFQTAGHPHYTAPFPERADYAFLVAPRAQALINVGDVSNAEA